MADTMVKRGVCDEDGSSKSVLVSCQGPHRHMYKKKFFESSYSDNRGFCYEDGSSKSVLVSCQGPPSAHVQEEGFRDSLLTGVFVHTTTTTTITTTRYLGMTAD